MARNLKMLPFALDYGVCSARRCCPVRVAAQQTGAPTQTSTQAKFDCRRPADPRRRQSRAMTTFFVADEALAGDWDGIRRAAKRVGITPTASYVGVLQTNVSGGPRPGMVVRGSVVDCGQHGFQRTHQDTGALSVCWDIVGNGQQSCGSLDSTILNHGPLRTIFLSGRDVSPAEVVEEKATILAGRLAAADSFAALPVFTNYVNYGINPNPFSLGTNDITFLRPPTGTQWGAQATYAITPSIQVAAGAFNTNLNSADGDNHGADFALQEGNKGVLAMGEIDYLRNQRANSTGKPGQITAGFLHSNSSLPSLVSPSENEGGYSGGYIMGQQMVYRPGGPGSRKGLPFGEHGHATPKTYQPYSRILGIGLEL